MNYAEICQKSGLTTLVGAHLEGAHLRGAYLEGTDLEGAYLRGAHLEGTDLFGTEIVSFQFQQQGAYFQPSRNWLKIGCEEHSLSEWLIDYEQIGITHGYTSQQIKIYQEFMLICQKIVEAGK
jgi:hypothetical protein